MHISTNLIVFLYGFTKYIFCNICHNTNIQNKAVNAKWLIVNEWWWRRNLRKFVGDRIIISCCRFFFLESGMTVYKRQPLKHNLLQNISHLNSLQIVHFNVNHNKVNLLQTFFSTKEFKIIIASGMHKKLRIISAPLAYIVKSYIIKLCCGTSRLP